MTYSLIQKNYCITTMDCHRFFESDVSNVVGNICPPPGWDRINGSVKIWGSCSGIPGTHELLRKYLDNFWLQKLFRNKNDWRKKRCSFWNQNLNHPFQGFFWYYKKVRQHPNSVLIHKVASIVLSIHGNKNGHSIYEKNGISVRKFSFQVLHCQKWTSFFFWHANPQAN